MKRRSLILRALLIIGIEPAGLIGWVSCRAASNMPRPAEATLDAPSESALLTGAEREDLVAFGEVLVEGQTLAPAGRRYLLEHIEDRTTRSSDYRSLYRTAASTLHRLAGRQFATLEIRERIDLIGRYRLAVAPGRGEELADEMRALRMRVVPDLIRGYYGSPAGWAAVGYETFPGRCGDLTRYTRREA